MLFYHWKNLDDYLEYLKGWSVTYIALDVQEVRAKEGLIYYAVLSCFFSDKGWIVTCAHQLDSTKKPASGNAGKLTGTQKKIDEKSQAQPSLEAMVKDFKALVTRALPDIKFAEGARWSTDPVLPIFRSEEAGQLDETANGKEDDNDTGRSSNMMFLQLRNSEDYFTYLKDRNVDVIYLDYYIEETPPSLIFALLTARYKNEIISLNMLLGHRNDPKFKEADNEENSKLLKAGMAETEKLIVGKNFKVVRGRWSTELLTTF